METIFQAWQDIPITENHIKQLHRELKRIHPLLMIAVFVVVFLEIHPFQDGDGRLSRVLTTLLLPEPDYAYVPYSSFESVIENSKEGYYLTLRQTQDTIRSEAPNWQLWLMFFMRALQQQKCRLTALQPATWCARQAQARTH